MEHSVEENINLLNMVYSSDGNVIHIDKELYGVITDSADIKLININNNNTTDDFYKIEHLADDYIILNKIGVGNYTGIIVDRQSFEKRLVHKYPLHVCGDIIYSDEMSLSYDNAVEFFDKYGKKLFSEKTIYGRLSVTNIDNTNIYILDFYDSIYIIKYEKEFNIVYSLNNCVLTSLCDTKYLLYEVHDCKNAMVIDILDICNGKNNI